MQRGDKAVTYKTILFEKADGIARVTLNRPDLHNALNSDVYNELYDVFESIENDPEVYVAVITGSGEKAFAAGSDVAEMADMEFVLIDGDTTIFQYKKELKWNELIRLTSNRC